MDRQARKNVSIDLQFSLGPRSTLGFHMGPNFQPPPYQITRFILFTSTKWKLCPNFHSSLAHAVLIIMIFSQALFFSHLGPFFHTGSGLMPIGIFGIEYCICICISQSVLDKDLPRLIAKITPCVWNVLYNTNILPRLTTWTLGRASDFVDFFSSPIHIFSLSLVTCACLMCSLSIQAL